MDGGLNHYYTRAQLKSHINKVECYLATLRMRKWLAVKKLGISNLPITVT